MSIFKVAFFNKIHHRNCSFLNMEEDTFFYKDMKVAHRRYKGYVMQEKFGTMIEDIEKLDVYDDDVWVIGFARSGTTWLQYVVWCIKNRLQLDKQDVISAFYRHIEYSTMFHQKEEDLPDFMRDSVGKVREAKRPRFIKSHMPWELLPKQIRTFERRPKIIHVVRDPRDVCTSNYHIYKLYNYYEGDYNFFCRFFLSGKSIWGPYVDNVCSYYKHKHQPNILLLKYEDMKSNIEAVLWKIANFLDVPLCDQDVQNILPRLTFDAMKSNPLVNKADTLDLMKTIDMCGNEGFEYFRIGKSGTWSSEEMSEEVQEMFKRTVLKRFDDIGLHYT